LFDNRTGAPINLRDFPEGKATRNGQFKNEFYTSSMDANVANSFEKVFIPPSQYKIKKRGAKFLNIFPELTKEEVQKQSAI
jgi:hypothetical protein